MKKPDSLFQALKRPFWKRLAKAHLDRARKLEQQNDCRQARQAYDEAIRLAPRLAAAWLARGEHKLRHREFEAARPDFERAIELNPPEPQAWLGLVETQHMAAAHALAVETLESAFKYWPDAAWLWYEYANALRIAKRDDDSLAAANRCLELTPREYKALRLRGNYFLENYRHAQAIPDFEAMLEIDPQSAETHASLGQAYYLIGDHARALAEAELAQAYDTGLDSGRMLRIQVLLETGAFEHALAEIKLMSSDWPDEIRFEPLFEAYLLMGRLELAMAETEARLDDSPPLYYFDRAQVLALMGELGPARQDLEYFAGNYSHASAQIYAHELRGWIALYAGEPDTAQAEFANSLAPSFDTTPWHITSSGRARELRRLLPVKLKPIAGYQDLPAYASVRECLETAIASQDTQHLVQAYDLLAELGRQWLARAKRR